MTEIPTRSVAQLPLASSVSSNDITVIQQSGITKSVTLGVLLNSKFSAKAVTSLVAAATAGAGARDFVSDSTVAGSGNFGAIVAGGGSNNVPVYCDGINWRIG